MSHYVDAIRVSLEKQGYGDVDPACVEAWMRLESGTLDKLPLHQFDREVIIAAECVKLQPAASRRLAMSYGLFVKPNPTNMDGDRNNEP